MGKDSSCGSAVTHILDDSTHALSVDPGGTTCQVTELSQDYSANLGGSTGPVLTTPCRRTAVTGQGVTLGCRPAGPVGQRPNPQSATAHARAGPPMQAGRWHLAK